MILRKTHAFHNKRGRSYPVPLLLILANQAGFLWLSRFFARCARKSSANMPEYDPENHEHLDLFNKEISRIHSDEMGFRLGILTEKNRRAVFKKFDIGRHQPARGDLIRQYQRQIAEVRVSWRRMRAFDQEWKRHVMKENRRWRVARDSLRRRQQRELSQTEPTRASGLPKRRRLFSATVHLRAKPGFQFPHSGTTPRSPLQKDGIGVVYVFARDRRRANHLLASGLQSAGCKILEISNVRAHDSIRPMPMDDCRIRPEDVLRAWETEEILFGHFWH